MKEGNVAIRLISAVRICLVIGLILASLLAVVDIGSGLAPSEDVIKKLAVPYIHQTYDTPDDFNGSWACAPTSAVMILAYYERIKPDPIWVSYPTPGHYSDYGRYISRGYSYNGHTFSKESTLHTDCGTITGKGAWGFIWQGGIEKVIDYLLKYLQLHDLSVRFIIQPNKIRARNIVQQEIDNGRPVIARTILSSAGHYVVIVGYEIDVNGNFWYLVNDPFGDASDGYGDSCWGEYVKQPVRYSYSQMRLDGPEKRGLITIHPETVAISQPPYTICPSGCSFAEIQSAIDAARSGDTITVGPGTYRETLTITKGLVLKGAGRDRTVIQGVERGRPVIRIESGHLIDVTIQGLTITGAQALPDRVCAESSPYLCPSGIQIWGQVRALIKDNKITSNANDGIDVLSGGYAEITDNLISQNGYEGIHLQQARAKISNNAIDKNGEIGILIWIDSEAEIRGNEIIDTKLHPDSKIGDGIEIIDNSKATIEGNTIERSARHGIWVGGGHYYADPSKSFRSSTVTIKNNIIKDSEDCGIYAAPPINIVSCSGNTVSGNKGGNYCGAARERCY